jgi:hypothetical protein
MSHFSSLWRSSLGGELGLGAANLCSLSIGSNLRALCVQRGRIHKLLAVLESGMVSFCLPCRQQCAPACRLATVVAAPMQKSMLIVYCFVNLSAP